MISIDNEEVIWNHVCYRIVHNCPSCKYHKFCKKGNFDLMEISKLLDEIQVLK